MRLFVPAIFIVAFGVALCGALPLLPSWTSPSSYVTELADPSSSGPSLVLGLLSSSHGLFMPRMVQTSHSSEPYWTNEIGKHLLRLRGVNFFDVTTDTEQGPVITATMKQQEPVFPTKLSHAKKLDRVYDEVSEDGPRENLAKFTSFRNRYYKSETGRSSQLWLFEKVKEIASANKDITVKEFEHEWGQNSIILHVPGRKSSNVSSSSDAGLTILGAHLDSTHLLPFLPAPGADDDGSGTVTILEALRGLLASGWQPETDVEWHWYSAEEGGLLGSQEVVREYVKRGTPIKAMLQQDMVAFVKQGTQERVGIVSDFTNEPLSKFVKRLVDAYLSIPYVDTKLGYAASDHGSWNKAGFPSAFAIEATYEDCNLRRIHSGNDVIDYPEFSFAHLMQFVRLSSAFVVELGGWAK